MPNILVIDDTNDIRSVVVETLHNFGFATREATDGETGLQLALAQPPDLIICDVRMPGMDGYRTLAAIREHPVLASTPFIFLTAAMDRHDFRRGMSSGADDYLTKPFAPEELLEAVTIRLARQSELKSEMYKRADKLRTDVVHLLTQEITGPLDGIMGLTAAMIREYSALPPETVLAHARHINESVTRLTQLTKSLA
ncbi:MAG TPA: response regulator [Verrucomicrobiae bacterium]|jgi:CheY-like chemotaxis protein|nr:response regulator [Verrucomicrobiae bacterium]